MSRVVRVTWRKSSPGRAATCSNERVSSDLSSLADVLRRTDEVLEAGHRAAARVTPSGFELLDTYLGGGFRAGELCLLGGPQGLGKTTFALQVLRNAVVSGESAIYFSFEHDAPTLLERLIALEAGEMLGVEALPLRRIREAMEAGGPLDGDLAARLAGAPGGPQAVEAVRAYADRLHIHRSTGTSTDIAEIRRTADEVREETGRTPLVVVDYLQKVFVPLGPQGEDERVTIVVEGLKDLALERDVPVLAVVAADKEGLVAGKRLRVHNLRGSSALAYEADVVLLLNDKFDVVARHHLVYDVGSADRFKGWVVLSIEKNRSGLDKIDLEFRKRFEQSRFEADGHPVSEQLVDERVYTE